MEFAMVVSEESWHIWSLIFHNILTTNFINPCYALYSGKILLDLLC